ncbi:MAG TPA: non-homologous end-joining DNA ligase [Patescibacteria group bacterium]|nr:non-homologous end-joining DNA ligase [Patescibacteria group bacterium]
MGKSVIRIGGRKIAVTNLEKILYPGGRFTKAKVIDYYARVAPVLLPHFRNRPVTLVRYPDGVFKEFFFEKNAPGFAPTWIRTFPVPRSEGGVINYILLNDLPTLLWAANLAALELHPFLHRAPNLQRPTHIVFDLDPGEGADILTCSRVAFLIRDVLAGLKLKAFPKVSGSKGIQVYVPLNTPATYDATQSFARAIADLLSRQHPKLIVSEMSKALRSRKVFIDWSQNYQTKTTVGVYSLRAKHPQPFVSMPVQWAELAQAVEANDSEALFFTPEAALTRIDRQGDIFESVLTVKQRLPKDFLEALPDLARTKSLGRYDARRDFSRTAEPEPMLRQRSAQGSRRRFVVQKHAAQHLHYDLRLEMQDVLKSWAVPKGIPLAQGERHSAFATEDHPLDYLEFEGVIPKGQYGGGTVMVWDIGTYDRLSGNYYSGELVVFLNGQKLKGEWTLNRLKENEQPDKEMWLLTKTGGAARRISSKRKEVSAVSGRRIEEIAKQPGPVWQSNRGNQASVRKRTKPAKSLAPPAFISPMKATLVSNLPEGPEWLYEVKWDGYRALAAKSGDTVRLLSLKNKDLASAFPTVVDAVRTVRADTALLDGEIVAVNPEGKPSFQALQNRASLGKQWEVIYYGFDLLSLDGNDLKNLPLVQRRAQLKDVLDHSAVRFSAELYGQVDRILRTAKAAGLEGIIAKSKSSVYQARTRSLDWRKFKLDKSQEFVIGGYNPEGDTFSSLLVGYYEGSKFLFAGKVRQGLNPASRKALKKSLNAIALKRCPFFNLPSSKTGHFGEGITPEQMATLRWARPELVARIRFTEWTSYGLLRHATFEGLRDDKDPREVVKELPRQT